MRQLRRVLLVEDDPDVRAVTDFALRSVGGFCVEVCASAQEALERAEAFAPDLILLDVMMAGIDGPAALLALREIPALVRTPVVFVTAKIQPQETARYKAMGSLGVIGKPFDPTTLTETLHEMWQQQGS